MSGSSQKFIARNRAPRVQIEYDVELYGSNKKMQIPFVMGVMADLSGKPAEPLAPVAERKFLNIDVDNFDERLKAMKPRVAYQVPNALTGQGNINVEITFESMDEAARELLALGGEVEVVEPPELRDRMSETARAIVDVYGGGESPGSGSEPLGTARPR